MGIVYLAEDPSLKREVAIKLVHRGTATQEEVLSRFRKEAEISARLNHPNVIMVFDVGEEKGYGPFMAMEYADGEVLSEILARGPMAPETAAFTLIQGFHALQAAHALGIIHRDFKPENLILTRSGRLKLMDFGIARQGDPALTSSGVLCTPSFAAPEILDRQGPSPSSDNWAFCVTACQMITGELPFKAGSISTLLYAIAHEPPVFPAGSATNLVKVFTRAFEKKPGDRYETLRDFMLDLLGALPLEADVRARCLAQLDITEPMGEGTSTRLVVGRRGFFLRAIPARVWWISSGLALAIFLAVWWLRAPRTRQVTLTSYPPHVQVKLDGRPLGTTPLLDVEVPANARLLRFELEGHQAREHLLLPDDRILTIALPVKPITLRFTSAPGGAEIFVNNVLKGITPVQGLEVPGGEPYHLQIRKAGYESWNAVLAPGEQPPETIRLRKVETAKKTFWQRLFGAK